MSNRRRLPMPRDPFSYVAQLLRRNDDGTVDLRLLREDTVVHLEGGEEFYTLTMVVDPFTPPPDAG